MNQFVEELEHLVLIQKYSVARLASHFGMHPETIRSICRNLNLKPEADPNEMPYGLTNTSYDLRSKLGTLLTDLTAAGKTRRETSAITGLTRNEICRAEQRPYGHDWKLSQIERLLKYHGLTLKDIM